MTLRAKVRDCLYLNWAFPLGALPPPPAPLRYQVHPLGNRQCVFGSALLFHHDALHFAAFPFVKVGFPQLNLRLHVLDGEDVPAVLFRRMLMPGWMAAGIGLTSPQPVERARLDFPRPSRDLDAGAWRWRAERQGVLEVEARQDQPAIGEGPRIGGWDQVVRYFVDRFRGYSLSDGRLRRVDVQHPSLDVWPMRAEMKADGFLPRAFALPELAAEGTWPPLHSCWLAPEIPFIFDVSLLPRLAMAPTLPQPAAGRMARPLGPASPGSYASPMAPLLRAARRGLTETPPPLSERRRASC
jgi:hypothetical protein